MMPSIFIHSYAGFNGNNYDARVLTSVYIYEGIHLMVYLPSYFFVRHILGNATFKHPQCIHD